MGASGWRDRNGIMYFAQGGAAPANGGYGGGYGQNPYVPGAIPPPQPQLSPGVIAANKLIGAYHPAATGQTGQTAGPGAPTGSSLPGMQASTFGNNPYNSGIPLSNSFVAQVPTSNLAFSPEQYGGAMQQSAGTLGSLQNMLMAQAQGGGPNLAAEQEKDATNRNIAQAYAMAQANPNNAGAMRNIATNVAGINQQAAADSAQQRMQQQLAAQGQLGQIALGQYGTSGRLMTDAQKLQLEQAQGNQQAALNAQSINAQTSAGNQQYGANVIGAGLNAAGAAAAAGATALGNYLGGKPSTGGSGEVDLTGSGSWGNDGGAGGGDVIGDETFAAFGGMIPPRHYDEGGAVAPYGAPNYNPANYTDYTGKSEVEDPHRLNLLDKGPQLTPYHAVDMKSAYQPKESDLGKATEKVVRSAPIAGPLIGSVADLGSAIGGLFSSGGYIPGHASKAGNNYENDTVKAMLSPGEVVLPRSVTQSPDAPDKAKEFVEAIRRRKKK